MYSKNKSGRPAPVFAAQAASRAFLLVTLAALAALSACSPAPMVTPTATKTARIEVRATATVTPAPSITPTAPAATDTPAPTATPAATGTPTPDPSIINPRQNGDVSFLTGLRPSDPSVLDRRPLAIKVANLPNVRPQSGLSQADIVVESRVEFEITRFTAIYQSQGSARVGSVRSARLIDVELPVIFDAILAFSGGVEPVRQKLYGSDLSDHILEAGLHYGGYYRDPSIAVPDNLFANTDLLWKDASKLGFNKRPQPSAAWVFSEKTPEGGKAATTLDITYPADIVSWAYQPGAGRWARSANGKAWLDTSDGKQITAADVVVLTATHIQTLILEYGTEDNMGGRNRSWEIQLWGEGPLKILRDGKIFEGKWLRADRHAPFRFVDSNGKDIPLKPGNSWWQVVAPDMKVNIK